MDRLVSILYELSLWVVACLAFPRMLYNSIVYNKYRKSFFARMGLKDQNVTRTSDTVIWIHSVSVGETKAVAKLAKELKTLFPHCQLVLSTVTETGYTEGLQSLPFADTHIYLPFDFRFAIGNMVKKLKPNLVIFCETDLWFNFLRESKNVGASIALVNGKLSERSMRRFAMVSFFSKRLFEYFDKICVQNNLYKDRFITAGATESKIEVTGNLKFDGEYPVLSEDEVAAYRQRLGISSNQKVITIGSTHDPEEKMLLEKIAPLWNEFDLKIIIVPRHPERFDEVAKMLSQSHIPFIKWSQIAERTSKEKVILVDAMGVLRTCYQLSDVSIVAGSFTNKVGGHNILEPCYYEKPVLFGPHMHTQLELVDMINQYDAGKQTGEDEVTSTLREWLSDQSLTQSIGKKGLRLVSESRGSLQRTLSALKTILSAISKEK